MEILFIERHLTFLCFSFEPQLELAITLLGTPQALEDFLGIPEWAERFLKHRMASSSCRRSFLSNMIPNADAKALHLLARMLTVSPVSALCYNPCFMMIRLGERYSLFTII